MIQDPRKAEHSEWRDEDSTANRDIALQSREHFLWLLDFHWVRLKTARILELGSGRWHLLATIKECGINITGLDARPRPIDATLPIHDGDVHHLSSVIEAWFYDTVISRDLLDTHFYNQNITKIGEEIAKILWDGGLYIGKEPNAPHLELPWCRKSIIAGQFQIFRKWWGFLAEDYNFSRRFKI